MKTKSDSKKTILITGGAGFVGSILVDQFLREGYNVKVLDNLLHNQAPQFSLFINKNFEFTGGDIRSRRTLKEAL